MPIPERLSRLEPLWGVWRIKGEIGRGSFGRVYELYREEFADRYVSALKWIALPKDKDEIDELRSERMSDGEIRSYYGGFIKSLNSEIRLMSELGGNSHIVNYLDHLIIERKDEIGWDILIRMELLKPLDKLMSEKTLSNNDVAVIGAHICQALDVCGRHGIIHRDIKPANIFISPDGNYKLGDFGVARTMEKTLNNMSRKGTPLYMAPEVYRCEPTDLTADIYSLGLVLYQLLNGNRVPFLPIDTAPSYEQREAALERRIKGDPLPPPVHADKNISRIILKACAYKRGDRYKNALEMKRDLERFLDQSAPSSPNKGLRIGIAATLVVCVAFWLASRMMKTPVSPEPAQSALPSPSVIVVEPTPESIIQPSPENAEVQTDLTLDEIIDMQQRLMELGWLDASEPSGKYDAATSHAVIDMKRHTNEILNTTFAIDSGVDEELLEILKSPLALEKPESMTQATPTSTPTPTPTTPAP
ncbi:MAG: serine/threonine-protein kinase, partial [Clostridia bacterium]|nr:serine/threonine-protein kinase [Clostridia bacterium]